MLALNTNQSIIETYSTCSKYVNYYTTKAVKKLNEYYCQKYEIRQWTRAIDQIGDVKTSHSTM
jgi:hypothetical protein